MKKQLLIIGVLLSMVTGLNSFRAKATLTTAAGPDETVIAAVLQKTYTPTSLFIGGNDDWYCAYKVMDTVAASSAAESNTRRMNFELTPLMLNSKSHTFSRYFEYTVQTSRGNFSGEQWLKTGQVIKIEANTPLPVASECIMVKIREWYDEDLFYLTNVIPAKAITPEQALRKTFDAYYSVYGTYPTADFTFKIDFYDKTYWLVTFNDNDGIGGECTLLIDALTGEIGDLKENE